MHQIIGKPPIHPFLFYSGKIAGYITWFVFIMSLLDLFQHTDNRLLVFTSFIFFIIGILFVFLGANVLGKSTRLGLPQNETILKTGGIYQISRNPMYVGFHCWTIGSIFHTSHWMILVLGLFSIWIYHMIIRAEERFLDQRFGEDYRVYQKKVRRYI